MKYWYLILILIASSACSNRELSDRLPCMPEDDESAQELMLWLKNKDNSYTKSKKLGDLLITSTLIPAKWKALSEGIDLLDGINPYSGQLHLQLKLEVPGFQDEFVKYTAGDIESYQNRVQYYSFFVHEDVEICDGDKCLKALGHSWERTYSITNSIVLEFHFDAKQVKTMGDFSLVFNDKIFNSGPVRFNYKPNDCLYE